MPEVPYPSEHHGDTTFIGRRNHLFVPDRAARLDNGNRTGISHHIEAVSKRKKSVARNH